MPNPIKTFSGNYPDLALILGLGDVCLQATSKEKYLADVSKDTGRIAWFSDRYTVDEMKARFLDTAALDKKPGSRYSFTQGNPDGGVFSQNIITQSHNFLDYITCVPGGSSSVSFMNSIRIAYINDKDELCGFTISYIRDERDDAIPAEQRKRLFTVTIIENTNLDPIDRRVVFYAHPDLDLLTPGNTLSSLPDVDAADVPDMIKTQLNSSFLRPFIGDLFNGDSISFDAFSALKARFPTNRNMDDRDSKKRLLVELCQFAGESSHSFISALNCSAATDVNFYLDEPFEQRLLALHEKLSNEQALQENVELLARFRLTYLLTRLSLLAETPVIAKDNRLQDPVLASVKTLRSTLEMRHFDAKTAEMQLNQTLSQLNQTFVTVRLQVEGEIKHTFYEKGLFLKFDHPVTLIDKPEKPKKLEQPFRRRNFYPMLAGGLAFLALIGLALTFTGVLAPLGLTISAATFALALSATAFSLGALALAGIKMIYNEVKYVKAKNHYIRDMGVYDQVQKTGDNFKRLDTERLASETSALRENNSILTRLESITKDFSKTEACSNHSKSVLLISTDSETDDELVRNIDDDLTCAENANLSAMSELAASSTPAKQKKTDIKEEIDRTDNSITLVSP